MYVLVKSRDEIKSFGNEVLKCLLPGFADSFLGSQHKLTAPVSI